jgi:hypothetical protein
MKINKTTFKKGHIPWNKNLKYSKGFIKEHNIGLNPNSRNGFEKHNNRNPEKRKKTMLEKYGTLATYGHLGKKHTEETKLYISGKKKNKSYEQLYGKDKAKEIKKKQSNSLKGKNLKEKNGSWKGGIAFLPYPYVFNNILKNKIRKRDKYNCQKCKKNEQFLGYNLNIHHIDYNKQNNNKNNLICLCNICHAKTNFNRNYWLNYFQNYMKGGKDEK